MAKARIATKVATNTFVGGMDRDLDKSVRPSNKYYNAQNTRITSDKDGTTGALANVEGNSSIISNIAAGHYIVGSAWIRNWLVVFTTTNTKTTPVDGDGTSNIYAFPFIGKDLQPNLYINGSNPEIFSDDDSDEDLCLSVANRIKAIGRYENDDIIKVYFTDGYNNVRWVNIKDTDVASQNIDKFEFISNANLSQPEISEIVSGNINVGMVQYAYQYYVEHGAETLFSPCSALVHLTTDSDYFSNTERYKGSVSLDSNNIYVNSGKGIKFTISNTNTDYSLIRIVAIEFNSLNTEPTVRLIKNEPISVGASTYTFVDIGESLDTYTYQEFAVVSRNLFKSEVLETKDDYLFAGNVTDNYFDIGYYDARSYRFLESDTTCQLYHDYSGDLTNDPYITCTGDSGSGNIEDTTWTTTNWGSTGLSALSDDAITDIPETADCVNVYNDYSLDLDDPANNDHSSGGTSYAYKYQYNSSTLGGSGYNIDFTFTYTQFGLDVDQFDGDFPRIYVYGSYGSYGYSNFASPEYSGGFRGYMDDETYRYGIEFYDVKGRRSYVRWIADIRMPMYHEQPFINWILTGSTIYGRSLMPQFKIKNMPSGAVAYKIVRCRKESLSDKNIITQGLLKGTTLDGTVEMTSASIGSGSSYVLQNNDYCLLASPDVSFGTNINYHNGDELHVIAYQTSIGTNTAINYIYSKTVSSSPYLNVLKVRSWIPVDTGDLSQDPFNKTVLDINNFTVIEPGDSSYDLSGSNTFNPYNSSGYQVGGTALLIDKSGDTDWIGNNDAIDSLHGTLFLCNLRRNNWDTMHGGNTYDARSKNTYISSGEYDDTIDSYVTIGYGDTFISYFDHLDYMADLSQTDTHCKASIFLFPVQSNYNLDLRHDDSYRRVYNDTNLALVQETSGTQINSDDTEYEQATDYYLYNTVYSQEDTTISFIAKPIDALYSLQDSFDTRVRSSDKKSNGEINDSWFTFRINNYIDLDSESGSLTTLELYKDTLMFFQPKGFGVLSVNPRSLIQDSSGDSLVLGTGGVLDRYDYISRAVGTSNPFGVAVTDNSIYWVDNNLREIIQYSSGIRGTYNYQSKQDPLGIMKGMSSYLKNLDYIVDVLTIVDRENNEILFTITPGRKGTVSTVNAGLTTLDVEDENYFTTNQFILASNGNSYKVQGLPSDQVTIIDLNPDFAVDDVVLLGSNETFTLSFNEILNSFGSFYSFTPQVYMDCDNFFLSLKAHYVGGVNNTLYLHNSGNYCNFYGTVYDSTVTFHVNQDYNVIKVFDNIFWDSKISDPSNNDKEIFSTTWTEAHFYNDYQNVQDNNNGTLGNLTFAYQTASDLSEISFERRERLFTAALPKNRVTANVTTNPDIFNSNNLVNTSTVTSEGFMDRLRDKYLTTKLVFDNSNNYKFVCPFVSTMYRYSIR